jgi:ubiquinone/menaquinone biosynthesis C-methylase UbiE
MRGFGMIAETEEQRQKRRHQRALFDGIADLYDECRRTYHDEVVNFMVTTAALQTGSAVLEVGCGTGQLTEQLALFGFDLTAIDIGPSMIAGARRRIGDREVTLRHVAFEDFNAPDASFDLVVSATAFHWVDPEVKFTKPARLLRPGGWLALLATGEKYDDPLGAALLDMWAARSDDGGAWAKQRKLSDTEIITAAGGFSSPIERAHSQPMVLPAEVVIGVENTRATSLSWPQAVRRGFTEELRGHLGDQTKVSLTQETHLTMAQVLSRP